MFLSPSAFGCETTAVDSELAINPTCIVTNVITDNLPIYAECSNHGMSIYVYKYFNCYFISTIDIM